MDWLEERRKGVQASEMGVLFDCGYAEESVYRLWQDKMGVPRDEDRFEDRAERFYFGHASEGLVAAALEDLHGLTAFLNEGLAWDGLVVADAQVVQCEHDGKPQSIIRRGIVGCTPDGIVKTKDERLCGLEIKCVDRFAYRKWPEDSLPERHFLQVQACMYCTGLKEWLVAVFVGGNELHLHWIAADEETQALIVRRAEQFWRSVEAQTPPPMVPGRDNGAIHEHWRTLAATEVIDAKTDESARRLVTAYRKAQEARKEAEKNEENLRAAVEQMLGTAAVLDGGDYTVKVTMVPASEGKRITPDMVGQVQGARKASKRLTVKWADVEG